MAADTRTEGGVPPTDRERANERATGRKAISLDILRRALGTVRAI
jgi:hypothetical protein